MASMSCHWPPWNEYSVSHQTQRNGQPVRRTNTVGQPMASASPWTEWNISVIRRRSPTGATGGTSAGVAVLPFMGSVGRLALQATQAFLCEASGLGARILGRDLLQRRYGCVLLFQLDLAVADLEQAVGDLVALGVLLDQALKSFDSDRIVHRHVIGLTQPVIGVGRERAVRILGKEVTKAARCRDVVTRPQRFECGVVGGLLGCIGGRRRCSGRCRLLRYRRSGGDTGSDRSGALRWAGGRGRRRGLRCSTLFKTAQARIDIRV